MNRTRLLALALCIVLALTSFLSACGGSTNPAEATSTPAYSESSEQSTQAVEPDYSLPFVKDGSVTLHYMGFDGWYAPASYTQNLPIWQEIEKKTGVKVVFDVLPYDQCEASIQTRLASNTDLPDITMIPPFWWNGGVMKYAESGVIIPLEDLIKKYAPDIVKLLENDVYVRKSMTAPDGHIYTVADMAKDVNDYVPTSAIIRKDWLEKVGLQEPQTINDWYTVLKAFKQTDLNGNGKQDEIPLTFQGLNALGIFRSGFGFPVTSGGFSYEGVYAQADGKVNNAFLNPGMKDMLSWLHKLYEEGLIDKEIKHDEPTIDAMISKNIVASYTNGPVDWIEKCNNLSKKTDANAEWTMVAPPKGADGSQALEKRGAFWNNYGITRTCKYPEVAIKWINYVWLFKDYGIEGKSYTMVDGKPQYTDFINNNPDKIDPQNALRTLGAAPALFVFDTKAVFAQKYAGTKTLENAQKLAPIMVEPYPSILATKDENDQLASLQPDIRTFAEEKFSKFIIGSESLDNYDKFVQQLKDMGIDKVIQINQQMYDRFNKE